MGMKGTVDERLNESFRKQNARREGSLDYTSFFEGYSAGLQERDIVLGQLTKAKELITDFLLVAKVEHLVGRYETVDEAEQFLKEK